MEAAQVLAKCKGPTPLRSNPARREVKRGLCSVDMEGRDSTVGKVHAFHAAELDSIPPEHRQK